MPNFKFISKLFNPKPNGLEGKRIEVVEAILDLYKFLETDYNYNVRIIVEHDKYPGGPQYYIIRYTNKQAQRQVEVVVHRNSDPIHRYVKKLIDGIVPDYKDVENCYRFWEIDMLKGMDGYKRSVPYGQPEQIISVIKYGLETLTSISQVLSGHEWFDRKKLEAILTDKELSISRGDSIIRALRVEFDSLVIEHNFEVLHDPNNLRAFEQDLSAWLVYGTLEKVVGISVDHRDQYFSVYLLGSNDYTSASFTKDGEQIFGGAAKQEEFKQAVRLIKEKI